MLKKTIKTTPVTREPEERPTVTLLSWMKAYDRLKNHPVQQ